MKSTKATCQTLSVILPVEKADSSLSQALSCFSGQTLDHSKFEILLVADSALREEIAEILQLYSSLSIRFLSLPENAALGTAFNLGVQNSRGDLLLIHDPELFPDHELLEAHLLAHQLPSNEALGVFSSVVPDPKLPAYLFNEGLRRANFLPRVGDTPKDIDAPALQGLSLSLPRELFLGAEALRFSEECLSRWGVEREFLNQLSQRKLRLARHPHACCLLRSRHTLESFEKKVREMTRDTANMKNSSSLALSECPTIASFSPELLPVWREHLKQSEPTVEILREELSATEGLIARTHSETFQAQSEDAINRIAECILLFREHLAQLTLVELHESNSTPLIESIETNKKADLNESALAVSIEKTREIEKGERH